MTPVWLLDVDGVVNASRPGWGGAPARGQLLADGQWWKLRWAPEVVAFIREVHEAGLAEIRWATTWVPWAAELEALWNLPPLPLAFAPDHSSPDEAKLPAAIAVVSEERRPLIWTDDERIPASGEYLDALESSGQPTLLLRPQPTRGLRAADVDLIREFLGRC